MTEAKAKEILAGCLKMVVEELNPDVISISADPAFIPEYGFSSDKLDLTFSLGSGWAEKYEERMKWFQELGQRIHKKYPAISPNIQLCGYASQAWVRETYTKADVSQS